MKIFIIGLIFSFIGGCATATHQFARRQNVNRTPASGISITTKIESLLDHYTFHNFSTHRFTHGFEILSHITHPETKIAEFPTILEGQKCKIVANDDSDSDQYTVGDKYYLRTIDAYQKGSVFIGNNEGFITIELVGPHRIMHLRINCKEIPNLNFKDISDDLKVIKFF